MKNTPTRSKAILAFIFAGGILNVPPPAFSDTAGESTESITQRIINKTDSWPEMRAYYLLRLASGYLTRTSTDVVESQYRSFLNFPSRYKGDTNWQKLLIPFAEEISEAVHTLNRDNKLKRNSGLERDSARDENSILAGQAVHEALLQLDKATNRFAKLNMYFIASCLYQKIGNIDEQKKCDKILEKAIRACESNSPADKQQIIAATSVLNSMAYGLVPLQIENSRLQEPLTELVSPQDFNACEKLRLRAVAIADHLSASNHTRRKVHRDLSLWYQELGKGEMAEKQKQILFELIGRSDDQLLYPQQGACGSLIWWEKSQGLPELGCGMG